MLPSHQPTVLQPSNAISGSAQGGHRPDTLWARRLARTRQVLGPNSFPDDRGCVARHDSESSIQTAPSIEKQEALAVAFISRGPSLTPDHGNERSESASSVLCMDQSARPATGLDFSQSSGTSLPSTSTDDRVPTLPSPAFGGLNARPTGAAKPPLLDPSGQDRWDSMLRSTWGAAAGVSNLSADIASEFHKWAKTRGGSITGYWRGIPGTVQSLLYEASDTSRPGSSSSSPMCGIDETRGLGRDSVAAHLASSTIHPELLELPPGTYDQQHVTPGPASGLIASSADFVDELNEWATTPGGGIVYPSVTSPIAPPSSSSQDHLPYSSDFASTSSWEAVPDVLDPRVGTLGADQAGCAVLKAPPSVDTARAGSTTRRSSSRPPHSSDTGFSASADATSSGSIITWPVPCPSTTAVVTVHQSRGNRRTSMRPAFRMSRWTTTL